MGWPVGMTTAAIPTAPDRARQAYRRIVSEAPWAAFGAIAAETELANLSDAENPVW